MSAPTCLRSVAIGALAGLLLYGAIWAIQAGVLVVRPVGEVLVWAGCAVLFLFAAVMVLRGKS